MKKRASVLIVSAWMLLAASWAAAWQGTVTEIYINFFGIPSSVAVIGTSTSAGTDCNSGDGIRYAVFFANIASGGAQTEESLNRVLSALMMAKTTGSTVEILGDCGNANTVVLR